MIDRRFRPGPDRRHLLRHGAALALAAGLPLARARAKADPARAEAAPMITRTIPSSGEAMPVIGAGTWQTFDVGADEASRAPLREVLRLLFDAGGRMLDSSPMYGRAEEVAGDLVAALGARERAFIATKVWTTGERAGIEQMRRSAELLRAHPIDLMQIHNLVDWQTHLKTLRRMKERGDIRYIGVTHYTTGALEQLARVIEREKVDFVQLGYSIATRAAEARLLPLAAERGVAVIVNQPFEQGALFRKVRQRRLPPWAEELGCGSWGQFFLKYIIAHPAVTVAIPATSRPEHMVDDIAAGTGKLPDDAGRRRMAEFWDSL
jgi:diketogulonate reductase-like aldo/keto reductase